MNNQTSNEQELHEEIRYMMQKFGVGEQDVKNAIQKVGTSSENLEQYFQDKQLEQGTVKQ